MAKYTAIPTRLNTFKVKVGEELTKVSGLTNISLTVGNEKDQYYTYDSIWQDTDILGKSMQITFEGKRYREDPAQNALVACVWEDGDEACIECEFDSYSEGTIAGLFAIEITEFAGGGDPNTTGFIKGVAYLKGEPTVTPVEA